MQLKSILRRAVRKIPCARTVRKKWQLLEAWVLYLCEFRSFSALSKASGLNVPVWRDRYPCLTDKTSETAFERHYVYHTGWAARVLSRTLPKRHVDISSSLYFVSIVSAFISVEHYDYRPPNLHFNNLDVRHGDLTALPFDSGSIDSLSCMHVLEHIGLGRYGDPLNPEGDRLAAKELSRVLSLSGILLFVVPVGRPRICFNAHRVYSYDQVRQLFPDLQVREFCLLVDDPDSNGLKQASPAEVSKQEYGCGCFLFQKLL